MIIFEPIKWSLIDLSVLHFLNGGEDELFDLPQFLDPNFLTKMSVSLSAHKNL